mmetsp:Transcript_15327/g.32649  ORF Transcript_15327/g.32649 Transcript_15327/m.32649 type:complete len:496 (+) Transcript_15327:60-1547(+)
MLMMPSTSIPVALADKGTTSPTSSKELHPRVYPEPLPAASRAEHVASPLKPYDGAKHLSQMTASIKQLVSRKKKRFEQDGFNLDLAYISPRIIAMGYPSQGAESLFRNPATEVRAFLRRYHGRAVKVFNLCAERAYDASLLGLDSTQLERYEIVDHNPCPLFMMPPFCDSLQRWLEQSAEHVVAVHCKAGKGRTGMMIAAWLVWSGACANAAQALECFGLGRTVNGKGVTIPSQRRYVHYVEQLRHVKMDCPLRLPPLLLITGLFVHNLPESLSATAYFTVEIVHQQAAALRRTEAGREGTLGADDAACNEEARDLRWRSWRVFDSRKPHAIGGQALSRGSSSLSDWFRANLGSMGNSAGVVSVCLMPARATPPLVAGDVKICINSARGKLCRIWFHTAFVKDGKLLFRKAEIDRACKDKSLLDTFMVELTLTSLASVDSEPEALRRHQMLANGGDARRCVSPRNVSVEDEEEVESDTDGEEVGEQSAATTAAQR